jgi:hypothetical protein
MNSDRLSGVTKVYGRTLSPRQLYQGCRSLPELPYLEDVRMPCLSESRVEVRPVGVGA